MEAIAEARVRVDEAPIGHRCFELSAQLAHVDVDRAVAVAQLAAPDGCVQLLAGGDRAEPSSHRHEQLELPHGQAQGAPAREHQPVAEPDLKLARVQRVLALGKALHVRNFPRGGGAQVAKS